MTELTQERNQSLGMNWAAFQSVFKGSTDLSRSISDVISNSANCDAKLDTADRSTGAYTIILQGTLNEEGDIPEKAA